VFDSVSFERFNFDCVRENVNRASVLIAIVEWILE